MKNTKNARNRTSKTTITTLIADLNRWYGNSWWISGLIMTGIFTLSVVLPGILG